jgi:hypothetical protein
LACWSPALEVRKYWHAMDLLIAIHHSLFTIHYPPSIIHDSRYTIHDPLFTIHYSRITIHHSRFTIYDSRFTIHHSRFTIHHSRYTSYGPTPSAEFPRIPERTQANPNLCSTSGPWAEVRREKRVPDGRRTSRSAFPSGPSRTSYLGCT